MISFVIILIDFFLLEKTFNLKQYLERVVPLYIGLISMSLLTLYVILKSYNEPFQKLIKAAKDISKKGRSSLIRVESGDEFELLAQSFNQMSHSISSQIKDLEKAQARLEEANQVKSRFLANLSHELRTPLNAIKVSSEFLLEDHNLDSDSKDFAHLILEGSMVLHEHLDHIFHLQESLDTSKDGIQRKFYLDVLVDESVKSLLPWSKEKKLDLDIEIPDQLHGVEYYGYYYRILVMLHILIDNSIKFTDFGFVRIEISCQMLDKQKDIVQFAVVDSGCGISEKDQIGIFDPFIQLDDSDTKPHDGLGLGLALANNHAKFFSTQFNIKSEANKGSRFSFEIILQRTKARKDP